MQDGIKGKAYRGAWVAQLLGHLTSAQVVISHSVGSSPMSGSVLMAQSLLGILSLLLSAPPPLVHSLCLALSQSK